MAALIPFSFLCSEFASTGLQGTR